MIPIALATAACWAGAALAFAGAARRIGGIRVNLLRLPVAVLLLAILHLSTTGQLWAAHVTRHQLVLLAASSVLGLAIGDSLYFHALAVLGARLGALLIATWPVLCAILSWPLLGEQPAPRTWFGIAVTFAGVAVVLTDPVRPDARRTVPGSSRRVAVLFGLLAALCQALGLILSKQAMLTDLTTEGEMTLAPLSATFLRIAFGLVATMVLAAFGGQLMQLKSAIRDRHAVGYATLGALLGPTLGVWLSLLVIREHAMGPAAAVMGLQPIMVMLMTMVLYGGTPSSRSVLGTIIAVVGTALLAW